MGEAARMPELGRNAIKGDLVLEPACFAKRSHSSGDAIYPAESPLSSDQDRSRSILRSFSRHLPSCDSFERRLGGALAGLAGSANRPHKISCTASPAVLVCGGFRVTEMTRPFAILV